MLGLPTKAADLLTKGQSETLVVSLGVVLRKRHLKGLRKGTCLVLLFGRHGAMTSIKEVIIETVSLCSLNHVVWKALATVEVWVLTMTKT